jgi:type VI protein secretion system component VasK
MDWSAIIVAAMALVGTMSGSYFANRKYAALIAYRLEELEKKVAKHNSLVERTYKLEQDFAVIDEKVKVANNRIKDLEGQV